MSKLLNSLGVVLMLASTSAFAGLQLPDADGGLIDASKAVKEKNVKEEQVGQAIMDACLASAKGNTGTTFEDTIVRNQSGTGSTTEDFIVRCRQIAEAAVAKLAKLK